MYYDLNIPIDAETRSADLRQILLTAKQLDYSVVALNRTVRDKISPEDTLGYPSVDISNENDAPFMPLRLHSKSNTPFRILKRVTLIIEDKAQAHWLNSTNPLLKSFDIVAIRPNTEEMFHKAVEELECDLVSLELSERISFQLRPKTIQIGVQRGIMFEISFSASLHDQTARRNLISNATLLARATKGKNLILSSAARRALDLRAPHDAMNLTSLFGLDADAARRCVSENCRTLVIHGETRLSVKSILVVEELANLSVKESWKVPGEKNREAKADLMEIDNEEKRGDKNERQSSVEMQQTPKRKRD